MKWLEIPQILWLIVPIVAGLLLGVILALIANKRNQARGSDSSSQSVKFTTPSWITYSALGLFIFCAFALAFTLNIFYSPLPANTGAVAMDSKAGENITIPNVSGSQPKAQPRPTADPKQLPGKEALTPTPTPTPISTSAPPNIKPTSFESERYVNTEYGFALRYPKTYIPTKSFSPTSVFYAKEDSSDYYYGNVIWVDVLPANSPEEAAFASLQHGGYFQFANENTVTLADGITYGTALICYTDPSYSPRYGQGKTYCAAFKNSNDGKFITVFCGCDAKRMDLFKEIVQTLEIFPVKSAAIQPKSKRLSFESTIYTNKDNGFSIQYPNTWILNTFYTYLSPAIIYAVSDQQKTTPLLMVIKIDNDTEVEKVASAMAQKYAATNFSISPGQEIILQDNLKAQIYAVGFNTSNSGQFKALGFLIKGSKSFFVMIINTADNYEEAKCMEILSTFRLVK